MARRFIPAALAIATLALAPFAVTPPAEAAVAKPLDVVRVHFDPAGKDRFNNAGYNAEYFQVRNTSTRTLDVSGYYVLDKGGKHRFTFPKGFRIGKGVTVTVRSGKGRNAGATLYWQKTTYVWNNEGDTLTLYSPARKRLETCDFSKGASRLHGTKTC